MTDPSFDHIDFGPGYIYAPYPALERDLLPGGFIPGDDEDVPVEEPNQVPIELRMTPPLELDEEFIRARLLQRDMVDEMFRRVAESISESLRQCATAPEVICDETINTPESIARGEMNVRVVLPPGGIFISGIDG